MSTRELEDRLVAQVQLMAAGGWQLYRRELDGAVFVTATQGSGISGAAHAVLLVITFGLWLPILIMVELFAARAKFCRLTFDANGEARYEPTKRPR